MIAGRWRGEEKADADSERVLVADYIFAIFVESAETVTCHVVSSVEYVVGGR